MCLPGEDGVVAGPVGSRGGSTFAFPPPLLLAAAAVAIASVTHRSSLKGASAGIPDQIRPDQTRFPHCLPWPCPYFTLLPSSSLALLPSCPLAHLPMNNAPATQDLSYPNPIIIPSYPVLPFASACRAAALCT